MLSRLSLVCGAVVALATVTIAKPSYSMSGSTGEFGTDRPGNDYRIFNVPPENFSACLAACQADAHCQAWSYESSNAQRPNGVCWLKNAAPAAVAKQITTSGVMSARLAQSSHPFSAGDRALRLVALGDSLTAGFGLPPGEAFPDRLQAVLRTKGFDVEVVNAGVGGNTAADGLARYNWSVPADANALIVELGTNDMLRGVKPEATRRALSAILDKAKAANIPALLAGVRATPNLGAEYDRAFEAVFPQLAAAYGAALYPSFLEGVAGDPTLNQPDGLHPNAEGVKVIVDRSLPAVEGLLNKASPLHPADDGHAVFQTVQYSGDLTGAWQANDGGTYYIRQIGDEIWWFGENNPNTPGWSNVAHGRIDGWQIRVEWADVPKGANMNNGGMVLRVDSDRRLVKASQSGAIFGGSVWTR
jgi:acyl-CoA thioesterase-1